MNWFWTDVERESPKTVVIIPARLDSKRLPRKVLLQKNGKSLIQHVWEAARQAQSVDAVFVATADTEIISEVTRFGGSTLLTSGRHKNGTECVAEASEILRHNELVVNIQADEPQLSPEAIDALVSTFLLHEEVAEIATLETSLTSEQQGDKNSVKVVTCDESLAHYFSRASLANANLHVGAYAYRKRTLVELAALPPSDNEVAEGLEQLRWLDAGYEIAVGYVEHSGKGIDTLRDYEDWVARS